MSLRLYLLLVMLTVSTLAQTFQYSRGWKNGRKRSDPLLNQQQQVLLNHRRPLKAPGAPSLADYNTINPVNGWNRVRTSDQVNEDGERLLYSVGRCAKMSTSAVKDEDKTDDDVATSEFSSR